MEWHVIFQNVDNEPNVSDQSGFRWGFCFVCVILFLLIMAYILIRLSSLKPGTLFNKNLTLFQQLKTNKHSWFAYKLSPLIKKTNDKWLKSIRPEKWFNWLPLLGLIGLLLSFLVRETEVGGSAQKTWREKSRAGMCGESKPVGNSWWWCGWKGRVAF